jgi:glutathione S-transferase
MLAVQKQARARLPTLWHIEISPYSEKVRWALDLKSVEHERRAPFAGLHIAVALWLTRGRCATFPVLELDDQAIGDSTAIIAALEERFPDPPLYPADPTERRRALELEDRFDQVVPHIRRLVFHELAKDRERFAKLAAQAAPVPLARFTRFAGAYGRAFTALRYRTRPVEAAEAARAKILGEFEQLEAELGSKEYLVGDRFTVADLTAAAAFYALVLPPEGPVQTELLAEEFHRFREPLSRRRGYRWLEEMFRRHRRPVTQPTGLEREVLQGSP